MYNLTLQDSATRYPSVQYTYRVGGVELISSVEFPQIELYASHANELAGVTPFAVDDVDVNALTLHYQGQAPFAGRSRLIEYYRNQRHGLLRIDERTAYWLDWQSQVAVCGLADAGSDLALELLLGPVTVLFFSTLNRYCLHAGCVNTPNGALALIAESGVGKSTLSMSSDAAWQQISDDVLVIDAHSLRIGGAFPQLKMPRAISDFYRGRNASASPKLTGMIRLVAAPSTQISVARLTARDALLQVVRHSVGAKLFNTLELQRHTLFSAQLANAVPIWRLEYPRDLTRLPQVRRVIIDAMQQLA